MAILNNLNSVCLAKLANLVNCFLRHTIVTGMARFRSDFTYDSFGFMSATLEPRYASTSHVCPNSIGFAKWLVNNQAIRVTILRIGHGHAVLQPILPRFDNTIVIFVMTSITVQVTPSMTVLDKGFSSGPRISFGQSFVHFLLNFRHEFNFFYLLITYVCIWKVLVWFIWGVWAVLDHYKLSVGGLCFLHLFPLLFFFLVPFVLCLLHHVDLSFLIEILSKTTHFLLLIIQPNLQI